MAKKVASLFAEIGVKTDKLKSGLDDSKKQITGIGKEFNKLGSLAKGALVTGVAGAAVVAGRELYNMGKQGAVVEQTAQSFEFLLGKVGAAPDLLERLRQASRGTVDDVTLMSSTMTLAAGASDDLAKELIANTPRLLEMAKASNKLNPSLGDTAFLYESIATGIKRSSPLILDNLGLTVKVGEANETFAKSVGKTVEELTAEEKQMALLSATMKAGDQLIAQVGGTVDAAGDDMARMEVQVKNLKDELARGLAPAIAEVSSKSAGFLKTLNDKQSAIDALTGVYESHLISQEKYLANIEALNRNEIDAKDVLEIATKAQEEFERQLWETGSALDQQETSWGRLPSVATRAAEALEEAAEAEKEAAKAAEEAAEKRKNANQAMWETVGAADAARTANQKLFADVDRSIASPIEAFIKDLEWMQAGGGQITRDFEAVKQAFLRGQITAQEAEQFTEQIFVQSQNLQVKLDEIDATQAAENVSDTLGVSIQDAKTMLDEMDDKPINIQGELSIAVKVKGNKLAIEMAESLFLGTGKPAINIPMSPEEAVPPGRQNFRQSGGPVGMNMPYMVGERGPELFVPSTSGNIVPNNQLMGGDTIIIHNHSAGAAALTNAMVDDRQAARLNASMGR